jgi:hypothetical protein
VIKAEMLIVDKTKATINDADMLFEVCAQNEIYWTSVNTRSVLSSMFVIAVSRSGEGESTWLKEGLKEQQ